jgi:hypothetical protein
MPGGGIVFQPLTRLKPIETRHHYIEENHIGILTISLHDGIFARIGGDDGIIFMLKLSF